MKHIRAFGEDFDINVERQPKNQLKVTVTNGSKVITKTIKDGSKMAVKL